MKVNQIIIEDSVVFLFTDKPREEIKELIKKYEDEEYTGTPLGYEIPMLTEYKFLGKDYPCISLWFDNEDIPNTYKDFN